MKEFFKRLWNNVAITSADDERTVYFKRSLYAVIGMMIVGMVASLSFFFVFLEGEEDIFVPDLIGQDLGNSLRSLNDKNLYPIYREDLNREDEESWGKVVSQDPPGGQIVKAGRRIVITIGRPPVVDRLMDLRGKTLSEARQIIFEFNQKQIQINGRAQIIVKEPITYIRNNLTRTAVLQQSPDPGSDIFGRTEVQLVVSDGPAGLVAKLPNLVGQGFQDAMNALSNIGAVYAFTARDAESGERTGVVVTQVPGAGTSIGEKTIVQLVMTKPRNLPANTFFGMVETNLLADAIPAKLTLTARIPDVGTVVLAQMNHPGGQVGIPYVTKRGTELILQRFTETIWSKTVITE